MRCVAAGDSGSLRGLAARSPLVCSVMEHPPGHARASALAEGVERLFFQFLEAQLMAEMARAEHGDDPDEQAKGRHKGAHLLRLAAAWRHRRTPARIRAALVEDGPADSSGGAGMDLCGALAVCVLGHGRDGDGGTARSGAGAAAPGDGVGPALRGLRCRDHARADDVTWPRRPQLHSMALRARCGPPGPLRGLPPVDLGGRLAAGGQPFCCASARARRLWLPTRGPSRLRIATPSSWCQPWGSGCAPWWMGSWGAAVRLQAVVLDPDAGGNRHRHAARCLRPLPAGGRSALRLCCGFSVVGARLSVGSASGERDAGLDRSRGHGLV